MGAGEGGGGHSPVKTHKETLYFPQLKSKTGVKQTQSQNQAPTPNHLPARMGSNHPALAMHPTQETPLPVVRGLTSGYRNRSEDPHTPHSCLPSLALQLMPQEESAF